MKTKKSTLGQIAAAIIGGVVVLICDYAGLLPGVSIHGLGGGGGMVKAGLFGFLGAVGGLGDVPISVEIRGAGVAG